MGFVKNEEIYLIFFLFSQMVGKNLSELFRKEIKIVNLPPLNLEARNPKADALNADQTTGISKLFTASSS